VQEPSSPFVTSGQAISPDPLVLLHEVLRQVLAYIQVREQQQSHSETEFGTTNMREKRYSPQVIIGKAAKLERIPWIGNRCFVMWTTIVELWSPLCVNVS
jgi:hypothetical protein